MSELTFYPDAHPETSSVDGEVWHYFSYGSGIAWASLVASLGTNAEDDNTDHDHIYIRADSTGHTDEWVWLGRAIPLFDTSTLPDDSTIISAIFSLYGHQKFDDLGCAPTTNIYSANPASNTALAAGDFDSLGTTAYCDTAITYADWKAPIWPESEGGEGYNDFVLNSTGLAAISKTGITKIGVRNANYDVAGVAPTWGAAKACSIEWETADGDLGQSYAPKLTIIYCISPTTVSNLATNIDSANSYLSGILTADGGVACDCGFQWGLTNAYGSTTSTVSLTTGQGFSLLITGLTANTTYHFKAFATNSAGTSYGSDVAFVAGVSSNSGYIWVETDDNRFHFMDAAGTEQINIAQSDFDATTFLYATSDNTPQAKTPAQVMAILSAQAAALFSFNSQAVTAVSEITLVPKASSTGAEGTIFYCSTDNSVYVATEE